MSLFSILNLGQSGTRAAEYGVHTSGENIANVNTPGFARRVVDQVPAGSYKKGGHQMGMGVDIVGARRIVDAALDRRVRAASSGASFAESRASHLGRTEAIFADLSEAGLSPALDRVFNAFERLAEAPQDRGARSEVLAAASGFASEMSRYGTELHGERLAMNDEVRAEVTSINQITSEVAELNKQIAGANPKPNDLLDRRAKLLDDLSQKVEIDVLDLDNGQVSVSLKGGKSLVHEGWSAQLAVETRADGMTEVHRVAGDSNTDLTGSIRSGTLGGLLAARDDDLGAVEASFDQYAFDVATQLNAVHAAGFGRDGLGGRNLFTAPAQVAGAAAAFTIDAAVAGNPDAIAAATDPLLVPGDNRNALAMAALRDQSVIGGETPVGGFRAVLASFGDRLNAANLDAESTGLVRNNLQTMQSSMSGVSLDEEMASLMQYRTAYQASAQVIKTADELLQTLLSLKS